MQKDSSSETCLLVPVVPAYMWSLFFRALTTTWIPRFYRLMTGGVCAAVPIAPVSDFCACALDERFMEEEVDRVERNGDGVQKRAGLRGRRIHR